MAALVNAPWIGVVLPMVLALLVLVAGRVSRGLVPWVASIAPLSVLAIGVGSLVRIGGAGAAASAPLVEPWRSALASLGAMPWFHVGTTVLDVGWAVDSLAALMLVVVGVVATMVMLFSAGYMHEDEGWNRYYALLCLFTGSMTLLVIGDSFTSTFVGWELVGATSYLLIGFWYRKPSAAAAAVKAFLTTRIGDIGLLIGIAVVWKATGTLGYSAVMERLPQIAAGTVTVAAVCIAIGAIGKSAQFPLHIWLPDAMEGPTPVSALIHAATMVAAGVYLVARTWPIFEAAPQARTLLLAVGTISALGAGLAAIAQRDIKKVLAYSTISQLGFMFAALGVGAWSIAFFHLITHAAFKALLFLTSGSVIHGSGTQDMREMGGLRKAMPVTFVMWLIGIAALVGLPPFSGFFSKDLILDVVWAASPLAAVALFVTAFATGLYSARATKLTFFGDRQSAHHAHESAPSMLIALGVLAVPALLVGFFWGPIAASLHEVAEPLSIPLSVIAVTIALAGAATGWLLERGEHADEAAEQRFGLAWRASANAFWYDPLVMRGVVAPTVALCRGLWAFVDRWLIDGLVEGTAYVAKAAGDTVSDAQSGDAQWYGAAIVVGLALMLAVTTWLGR